MVVTMMCSKSYLTTLKIFLALLILWTNVKNVKILFSFQSLLSNNVRYMISVLIIFLILLYLFGIGLIVLSAQLFTYFSVIFQASFSFQSSCLHLYLLKFCLAFCKISLLLFFFQI